MIPNKNVPDNLRHLTNAITATWATVRVQAPPPPDPARVIEQIEDCGSLHTLEEFAELLAEATGDLMIHMGVGMVVAAARDDNRRDQFERNMMLLMVAQDFQDGLSPQEIADSYGETDQNIHLYLSAAELLGQIKED